MLGQGAVFDNYLAMKWTAAGTVELMIWTNKAAADFQPKK
jgi:hypothetical protein